MHTSNEQRLRAVLRASPPREIGSRLLSAPDRMIAMAAWGCGHDTAELLLSQVPGAKQARVREEYAMLQTRRHRPADMQTALAQLTERLRGSRIRFDGSWLRPVRRRER